MSNVENKIERRNSVELYTSILRYVWDNSTKEVPFVTKPMVLETNYLLGRTSSPKCANQWFKDNRADVGMYQLPEIVVDLTDIINGSRLRTTVKKPTDVKNVEIKQVQFQKGIQILKDLVESTNQECDDEEIVESTNQDDEEIVDDDEEEQKFSNILIQLYKSIDSESTIKTVFENGESLIIPKEIAQAGIDLLTSEDYKTEHRLMFQTYSGQSYNNLLEMIEQNK